MKNLQFNPYQSGAGCGGAGQDGLGLKSVNPSLPRPPLRDDKNPLRAMRGRAGQAGQSKIVIPNVTF